MAAESNCGKKSWLCLPNLRGIYNLFSLFCFFILEKRVFLRSIIVQRSILTHLLFELVLESSLLEDHKTLINDKHDGKSKHYTSSDCACHLLSNDFGRVNLNSIHEVELILRIDQNCGRFWHNNDQSQSDDCSATEYGDQVEHLWRCIYDRWDVGTQECTHE